MIEIQCIEDAGELGRLAGVWNGLLQRSDSDSLFLTWEWVWTWWEVYGDRYHPLVLVARDHGEVVGIAPLMVARGAGRVTRHVRYLLFIGQNEDVTPEYLDFFVVRGREAEVTPALCEYLIKDKGCAWEVARFESMLDSSPNLAAIQQAFARRGSPLRLMSQVECPYAELPDSWDAFLQSKSKHFRKRVTYNLRRIEREGEVRLHYVDRDVSLEQAYDELVRLNKERWGEEGESFRSERYLEFHRRVCRRLLPQGWLLLVLFKVADQLVAAKYDYCYASKLWGNQGGWLREYEKKEIGNVFIGKLIEWGIDRGYNEYDFLGGGDEYKKRWGDSLRMMADYEGWNDTLRSRAFRAGQQGRNWVLAQIPADWRQKVDRVRRTLGI